MAGVVWVYEAAADTYNEHQIAVVYPKAIRSNDAGVAGYHRYQRSAIVPIAKAMKHRQPTSAVVCIRNVSPT
jgi:hypothetical protein